MNVVKSERGFEVLEHEVYPGVKTSERVLRLALQSSAIGEYDDSMSRPGSSYLWIAEHHHLNREEVEQFVGHLQSWLNTGSMNL